MKTVDGFTRTEAFETLLFCVGHINCMQIYLDLDRENNRDQEYSLWKLKEAEDWLQAASKRMKTFGFSFLDQKLCLAEKEIGPWQK